MNLVLINFLKMPAMLHKTTISRLTLNEDASPKNTSKLKSDWKLKKEEVTSVSQQISKQEYPWLLYKKQVITS